MSKPNHQPVALVTGAGSGIGQEVAAALAATGHALALVGRREDALEATAARLAPGTPCLRIKADLSHEGEPGRVVNACVERFGRVDVLINNAGVGDLIPLAKTTPEDVERALKLNVLAPAALILACWPHFAAQHARGEPGGRIINVSSMASFDPFPGFFAYAASKAGLDLLTVSSAKEGQDLGIKAFSVNPGAVETPMLRRSFDEKTLPKGAALEPLVVAQIIMECAIGALDGRNGQRIPVLSEAAKAWYTSWAPAQRMPMPLP
jgi:3-oxoacyl-[acyl-carrier protein] reductase